MLDEYSVKYCEGDVLAVTIKPDDKFQYGDSKLKGSERLLEFYNLYHSKFERLFESKHYDYRFNIEVSEPIGQDVYSSPRMHLHGIVKLKTRYAVFHWLMDVMPDLLIHARLQIAHYRDVNNQKVGQAPGAGGWLSYCVKQSRYIPSAVRYLGNYPETDTTWLG